MTLSPADLCIEWAKQSGAIVSNITVSEIPGRGNCLISGKTESEDTALATVHIPKDLLLTLSNILQFAEEQVKFKEIIGEWSQRFSMTSRRAILLLMAWDHRYSSPWSTYLKSLPDHIDSPIFWTSEARKLLAGTSIEGVAEDKIGFLTAWLKYQQTLPHASQFSKSITLGELMRYEMLVDSRALLSNEDDSCMVPVIDFANHSSLRGPLSGCQNATWEMTDSGFTLNTVGEILDGNEILFSYGKRGNAELLFKYGFVEDWQVAKGSRSITIELPYFAEFGDVGEPSFRIGSDDDEDLLSDTDSQYLWMLTLHNDVDVEWDASTFRGVPFTKRSLRSLLAATKDWPSYQGLARKIAREALWAQLDRLEMAEQDEDLMQIAKNVDPEKLQMIDAVRDAERRTLEQQLQLLIEPGGISQLLGSSNAS